MNKTTSTILATAVSGLLLGSITGCSSETDPDAGKPPAGQQTPDGTAPAANAIEKHACKGLNSCTGKGGCKTAENDCAGKNSCDAKGGCATVAKHGCSGKNDCKGQGGCKTAEHDCAGKNDCKAKGGCAVPVEHK